jgi:hypothetical protein
MGQRARLRTKARKSVARGHGIIRQALGAGCFAFLHPRIMRQGRPEAKPGPTPIMYRIYPAGTMQIIRIFDRHASDKARRQVLLVGGVTTEVCIDTIVRETNDRGFRSSRSRIAAAHTLRNFRRWVRR